MVFSSNHQRPSAVDATVEEAIPDEEDAVVAAVVATVEEELLAAAESLHVAEFGSSSEPTGGSPPAHVSEDINEELEVEEVQISKVLADHHRQVLTTITHQISNFIHPLVERLVSLENKVFRKFFLFIPQQ